MSWIFTHFYQFHIMLLNPFFSPNFKCLFFLFFLFILRTFVIKLINYRRLKQLFGFSAKNFSCTYTFFSFARFNNCNENILSKMSSLKSPFVWLLSLFFLSESEFYRFSQKIIFKVEMIVILTSSDFSWFYEYPELFVLHSLLFFV